MRISRSIQRTPSGSRNRGPVLLSPYFKSSVAIKGFFDVDLFEFDNLAVFAAQNKKEPGVLIDAVPKQLSKRMTSGNLSVIFW